MKTKTSELEDVALDWAAAEASGTPIYRSRKTLTRMDMDGNAYWKPSTDWVQGGAIIERERVELEHDGYAWWARIKADDDYTGPTPLIAAMRCYVASKLGDEVDIPEELFNEGTKA
jgi:hypothetical protein